MSTSASPSNSPSASSSLEQGSPPLKRDRLQVETEKSPSQPFSDKQLRYVRIAAFILGICGLASGITGICGYHHIGALRNLTKTDTTIFLSVGFGGGVPLLLIGTSRLWRIDVRCSGGPLTVHGEFGYDSDEECF